MLIDTDAFSTKHLEPGEQLAPDQTALIIIDMMNKFCDAKWLSGGNAEQEAWLNAEMAVVIPKIQEVLEGFRRVNGLIVHVVNAKWTEEAREAVGYQKGREYGFFDSPEMSVIDELAPRRGEIITRKVCSSAFTGTGLDYMLNNAGIKNVVLTGTWGSACVFYSTIQSREYGFSNIYAHDAVFFGAERDKHLYPALVGSSWARLATAEEVVKALGA